MGEPVLKSSAFGFPIGVTKIPVSLSSLTEVDVNGLPRLPLSVTCYARFRQLSHIRHPNLCRYLDAVREKGEIISVISEYYSTSFYDLSDPVTNVNWLLNRFYECLSALAFMNDNGLVHSCLTPEMIMLDPDGHVKIGGYGIFYGTEWCDAIDFVLHNPVYSAPEVFLFLCNHTRYPSKLECSLNSDKCWVKIEADVWSLGLIFFEIIHSRECANPLLKSQNDSNGTKIRVIEQLLKGLCQADHYPTLPEFLQLHLANNLPSELATFDQLVRDCLRFNALIRPSPRCLMKQMDKLFISNYNKDLAGKSTPYFQKTWNHSKRLEFQPHSLTSDEDKNSILKVYNFVNSIKDLSELYYYWKLTGGRIQTNVQSDVKSIRDYNDCRKPESIKESESVANDVDFTYLLPPILRIPHYLAIVKSNSSRVISSEEQWPSNEIRQPRTFQLKITPLSSRRFIERISRTPLHNLYPLLICRDFKTTQTGNNNVCAALYSFSKNNSNRSVPSELLSTLRSSVKHNPVLLESNKSRPDFLNLLFTNDLACDLGVDWCMSSTNDDYESNVNSISQQPLSVRETDVDYQIVRTRLFTRILNGLPATKQYLRLEARKDIPPFLRWKVWAALLEVYPNREFESSYLKALYEIRKLGLEVSPTDEFNNTEQNNDSNKNSDFNCDLLDEKVLNQISVDLPRCHAYDPLLASPVGQSVLRRVLIATLLMKPGALDYTQGMDSIAAVFVRICYPDEVLAAACLNAFLSTKLPGFFSSGGLTFGLKSYFNTLLRLLAFHLPRLAVRLVDINVPLIGLTTGWIYTLFAHAMPLDRVELLWDTIMPGPASLSMFFYIAFFVQLDRQINFKSLGLEKICTILSNFPDFNLDKCRTDALKLALATPRSLTAWSIPNKQCSNGESMEAVGLISQNNFSKEVSNLVNTKENTPSTCDFYTRLTLQNAWPDHLEYSSSESSEDIDTNTLSSVCEKYNISLNASKLVSILSAKDALEHIKRPDCLVLDLRNSKEYDKFHLPNSVHCDLSKCMTLDSPLSGTESSDILSPIESYHDISLENWEMIDFPSWNRNRPQIIPEFLANLMNQKLWRQATQARQSVNLNSSQGTANESTNIVIPSSPGLLIVFGNDERLCWHLAYWLIKHDIDRVCILSNINSVLSTFLNSCFQ